MFSILPLKDKERLSVYPEGTTLLEYKEDGVVKGYIAYRQYKSAYELLALNVGEETDPESDEAFLRADALVRSVGAIALGDGVLTLCTKDEALKPIYERLGFFKNGDFKSLYLNKLFGGVCKGCKGGCGNCH